MMSSSAFSRTSEWGLFSLSCFVWVIRVLVILLANTAIVLPYILETMWLLILDRESNRLYLESRGQSVDPVKGWGIPIRPSLMEFPSPPRIDVSPLTEPVQEKVRAPRRTASGVAYQEALHVLKQTSSKIPCLYFIIVGEVNEMKEAFKVPDIDLPGHYFCKVGRTNDLYRRLSEHNDKYGTMCGATMRMASFETVKEKKLPQAEAEMLDEFSKVFKPVDNPKYNEVFMIPGKKMLSARKIIETVAAKFC